MRTKLQILLIAVILAGCVAAPVYEGEPSKNFNGSNFVNTIPMYKAPTDTLKMAWQWLRYAETWPDEVRIDPQKIPNERVSDQISVTFINHSTALIQVAGLNILTDPIYSERASPFTFAGPKRVYQPGVTMDDLPEIDLILISHNHYDHLDAEALQSLFARQANPPKLLAGLGNAGLFAELGLTNFEDLQWDQSVQVEDILVTFVECRHRSGRGLSDQMKTLWGSFVIEAPQGNIYFAGDTGYSPHFKAQGERFGEFALTLLPIGAYEPRWFMADIHLNPEEAVQAHQDLNSQHSLAIHFGTFQLTFEGIDQPVQDLDEALRLSEMSSADFRVAKPGETFVLN